MLPKRLGCGSGMTCWRRTRDWQQDGIWDLIGGLVVPKVIARFAGLAEKTKSGCGGGGLKWTPPPQPTIRIKLAKAILRIAIIGEDMLNFYLALVRELTHFLSLP
jgi:hypothetical protein